MVNLLNHAQDAAKEMVLGCENAAAEPYMNVCMLNDLRSHLAWGAAGYPVPLYPYLFHEYVAGFTGNGVCLHCWIDYQKTPFFLQWTLGWNFVNGNLLAVVLKEGGNIHWSWGYLWSNPAPEQQNLKTLIGNLCQWQQGEAKDILSCGKMVKTPKVICTKQQVFTTDNRIVELSSVECAAYEIGNKQEILLVNYNPNIESVEVQFTNTEEGVILYPKENKPFASSKVSINVPPLNAVLIKLDK
jgi:hypothetical protein